MEAAARRLCCWPCKLVFRKARHCLRCGGPLERTTEDPLLGTVVGGTYLLQSVIGEGAMARVYFATDEIGVGRFAVKLLDADLAAHPRQYERFVREAAWASGFSHPNLVRVLDVGSTSGGQPYSVMEHVPGAQLTTLIREDAPWTTEQIISIIGDLCSGLAYLHQLGIIHRDVKPGNVIVDGTWSRPVAKLVDYGVALEQGAETSRLTTKQTVVGTLSYMAPERALGKAFDHRADLFSVGVILYQLLSGKGPFEGTPMMVALQHMTHALPPVRERAPGSKPDPKLEAMANKLMAKAVDERYPSAEAVLAELAAL